MEVVVTTTGPIFDGEAPAITKAWERGVLDDIGHQSEEIVRNIGQGHIRVWTGAWGASIEAEVVGDDEVLVHGDRIIYGAWLEGVGSRNATTRFPGYHSVREATPKIQEKANELADERLAQLCARLGG